MSADGIVIHERDGCRVHVTAPSGPHVTIANDTGGFTRLDDILRFNFLGDLYLWHRDGALKVSSRPQPAT